MAGKIGWRQGWAVLLGIGLLGVMSAARTAAAPTAPGSPTALPAAAPAHYAPYAFLIGEWDVLRGDGSTLGVERFIYGPQGAYIWHSMTMLENDVERPHFEGMLMWNGAQQNLDMLISVENGMMEERGTVSIDADGTVVREIAAYAAGPVPAGTGAHPAAAGSHGGGHGAAPAAGAAHGGHAAPPTAAAAHGGHAAAPTAASSDGASGHFRQTFRALGPDRVETTVMRRTADGWVATFPGSERLIMTRRKAG